MYFNVNLLKMNDPKDTGFKSYIDNGALESISLNDEQKTKFLEGETIVCEFDNVLMYDPLSDRKKATVGVLTVTTFKLSFACGDDELFYEECVQQNKFLGINDVCLSCIDTIYQVGEKSRKKLVPGQNVTGKIKDLLVVCKNMRTFEFGFCDASKDSGKNIANSLLHHAFPKRHSLLFAYEYKGESFSKESNKEAKFFRRKDDWRKEYERTKCKNWRISDVNLNFQTSQMLNEFLIVPQSVTDSIFTQAVEHFRNRCCPVWVWGTSKGAALVRMADLLPTIKERTQENILLEHIRKSHPDKKQPHLMDLTKDCPSPKDVHNSYVKLRELCVPENARVFKNQDFKFYGLIDSSKWLSHVGGCLGKAVEGAHKMGEECCTVVLQEGNGQDFNCIISSLIQIIMDPYFRTKYGFQSLIQKEWISMGHPFANRLGHIISKDIEPAPLFLLFLDCVWQLLQQFPSAFSFSQIYLISLWDSAHVSIFDTFIFNSEHDRNLAERGTGGLEKLSLRSVWQWDKQYYEKDILLFSNPLYVDSHKEKLDPEVGLSSLEIWTQCYFRWLPDLEIQHGGLSHVDLFSRYVVADVLELMQKLKNMKNGNEANNFVLGSKKEDYVSLMQKVNSFFPFSRCKSKNTGMTSLDSVLLTGDNLDSQSILNLNND